MKIEYTNHYYTLIAQEAPPPPPIRTREEDWWALTPDDRALMNFYLSGLILLDRLPLTCQVFVRRHYAVRMES